ncbi:hypothetical protein MMC21_003576 [Puttea exsequens]|nr:hypothetical protein [Puttea exsequens]
MGDSTSELPSSDSHTLALLNPTQEEKLATWKLNGSQWKGAMSLPTYLRRERHLESQEFTRDGGITFWILVDTLAHPNTRPILASCETLRKRALIARGDGEVEDMISYGIGSVFCNPDYRGKGYAQRMITELGKKLDTWQQKEGKRANFTVLYSDIGKKFYSRLGWNPFPSSHVALLPADKDDEGAASTVTKPLFAKDLTQLCSLDEQWLRKALQTPVKTPCIRVALIPDAATLQWHHAREEFYGKEMVGRDPGVKGAYVKIENGDRIWCIWVRTFNDNTLNILRLVIEGEDIFYADDEGITTHNAGNETKIKAVAAVLRAAQVEAATWNLKDVQIWNPMPLVVLAAQQIETASQVVHRDEESIASLRWHGIDSDRELVQWVGIEKFGWC